MALTGSAFGTLVVLAAVAGLAAVVWYWPRLSGTGWWPLAARAAALLGVNALVLLAAVTQLNSQYLFFSSWHDLTGALSGSSSATTGGHGGGSARAATGQIVSRGPAGVGGGRVFARPAVAGPADEGATWYTVRGTASGVTGQVLVRLPPGYGSPADATVRYPVLETFPGYPGGPDQWLKAMQLGSVLDRAVAQHRIAPAILVSPQTEVPRGADTECVNGAAGLPQVETWLTQDVPAWVEATFRVSTARSAWATIGLSAGGWCAAMATMLHPDRFAAAVVLGGYFTPQFGRYRPYPAIGPWAARYDLVLQAGQRPPPVALWLETSHADPVSYTSSAALLHSARAPLSVTATVLQDAGHRISLWRSFLPSALAWLGSSVPGFSPVGPLLSAVPPALTTHPDALGVLR